MRNVLKKIYIIFIILFILFLSNCKNNTNQNFNSKELTEYTINFYGFNGDMIKSISIKENEKIEYPDPETIEGYQFVEWDVKAEVALANLDITTKYEETPKYTLTYYVDSEVYKSTIYNGVTNVTLDDIVLDDFIFKGWQDENGNDITSVEVNQDVNVYAHLWVKPKKISYGFYYTLGGNNTYCEYEMPMIDGFVKIPKNGIVEVGYDSPIGVINMVFGDDTMLFTRTNENAKVIKKIIFNENIVLLCDTKYFGECCFKSCSLSFTGESMPNLEYICLQNLNCLKDSNYIFVGNTIKDKDFYIKLDVDTIDIEIIDCQLDIQKNGSLNYIISSNVKNIKKGSFTSPKYSKDINNKYGRIIPTIYCECDGPQEGWEEDWNLAFIDENDGKVYCNVVYNYKEK